MEVVVSATSWQHYLREGDPGPVLQEAGPVWRVAPTGILSSDRPARSELLYRLHCHGPCFVSKRNMEGTCKLNREVISYLVSTWIFLSKLCRKSAMNLQSSEKCEYWSSEKVSSAEGGFGSMHLVYACFLICASLNSFSAARYHIRGLKL